MKPWRITRAIIGPLVAPFYGLEVARRNRRFDRGVGVLRLPGVRVVSIGNLSTGGTGKTPMVMWAARRLLAAGQRPLIAMRGYKADAEGRSDEAEEYRRVLPTVPVVVGAERFDAVSRFLGTYANDAGPITHVLLDDGFQHRRLARDVDIVLIDATRPPTADRLLPWGDLREPVSSLSRAHAAVLTRCDLADAAAVEQLTGLIRRLNPGTLIARCRHEWTGLADESSGAARPLDALRGKRLLAVCAIGNPEAFITQCGRLGCNVRTLVLPDHDPFDDATIRRMLKAARSDGVAVDAIIVTEKDWSKLADRTPPGGWPAPILRPMVAIRFDEGEEKLSGIILRRGGK